MGAVYWIVLWVVMTLAFGLAWTFIVKGCELMDRRSGAEKLPSNDALSANPSSRSNQH